MAAEAAGFHWIVDSTAIGHPVSRRTIRVATAGCNALRLLRANDSRPEVNQIALAILLKGIALICVSVSTSADWKIVCIPLQLCILRLNQPTICSGDQSRDLPAPLSEMNSVVEGSMIGGLALAAAPADYRVTSADDSIVSWEGVVDQKEISARTR